MIRDLKPLNTPTQTGASADHSDASVNVRGRRPISRPVVGRLVVLLAAMLPAAMLCRAQPGAGGAVDRQETAVPIDLLPEQARIALETVVDDQPLRDDAGLDALLDLPPAVEVKSAAPATFIDLKNRAIPDPAQRGRIFQWRAKNLRLVQKSAFGRSGVQAWTIQPDPQLHIPAILLFVGPGPAQEALQAGHGVHIDTARLTARYWKRCSQTDAPEAGSAGKETYLAFVAMNIDQVTAGSATAEDSLPSSQSVVGFAVVLLLMFAVLLIAHRMNRRRARSEAAFIAKIPSGTYSLESLDSAFDLPADPADALSVLRTRAEGPSES